MLYFGDADHPSESFISITKVSLKHNAIQTKWAMQYEINRTYTIKSQDIITGLNGAEGKIILFEGTPAIITDYDNMQILEPVDYFPPGYDFKKSMDSINRIYEIADKQPEFAGGAAGLELYLKENLKWPKTVTGVSGKIYVSIVVERDGSLTNIKVAKGLGQPFDAEAIRVIRASPKWHVGLNKGKPVRVAYVVPVSISKERKDEETGDDPGMINFKKDSDNQAYSVYDKAPEFPGGKEGLNLYLKENLKMPKTTNGINGKVVITFIVEKDGSLNHVKVLKGFEPAFDNEALKVIKDGPKWRPGSNKGKLIRAVYNVSVDFSIIK